MHIKKLEIENFKSIKKLSLDTKRVNVFIGEPNSGKTNIIEAMSLLSIGIANEYTFKQLFRFDTIDDLFIDSDISQPIKVTSDILKATIAYNKNEQGGISNNFLLKYFQDTKETKGKQVGEYTLTYEGKFTHNHKFGNFQTSICYYYFNKLTELRQGVVDNLEPPFGNNILSLLLSNRDLRNLVSDIFREKGFRLEIRPKDFKIRMVKDKEGILYSYPYQSISETLQRIVFMMLAIESNNDFTLLFDEPESNTFPFYTKFMAERIALKKSNQYFFTTHNPYLLMSIIEKTPSKELNVVVTKMKKYETQCYPLNAKQLDAAVKMGHDMFFNLDKLIK